MISSRRLRDWVIPEEGVELTVVQLELDPSIPIKTRVENCLATWKAEGIEDCDVQLQEDVYHHYLPPNTLHATEFELAVVQFDQQMHEDMVLRYLLCNDLESVPLPFFLAICEHRPKILFRFSTLLTLRPSWSKNVDARLANNPIRVSTILNKHVVESKYVQYSWFNQTRNASCGYLAIGMDIMSKLRR